SLCSANYGDGRDRQLGVDVGASAFITRDAGYLDTLAGAIARSRDEALPTLTRPLEQLESDRLRCAAGQLDRQLVQRATVQARYTALMDHAQEGICMLDDEGIVVEVNRAWLAMVGRIREAVVGRSFLDAIVDGERALHGGD